MCGAGVGYCIIPDSIILLLNEGTERRAESTAKLSSMSIKISEVFGMIDHLLIL